MRPRTRRITRGPSDTARWSWDEEVAQVGCTLSSRDHTPRPPGLHLAKPVEVAQVHRDVLRVRDDEGESSTRKGGGNPAGRFEGGAEGHRGGGAEEGRGPSEELSEGCRSLDGLEALHVLRRALGILHRPVARSYLRPDSELAVARSARRGDDARHSQARRRARARARRAPGTDPGSGRGPDPDRGGEHLRHRPPHQALGPVVGRARAPPLTLGHELCGTVVAIGGSVRGVAEGDYVSAESHVTCGTCFHCRTGKAHMCERTQILGVDRNGGFADYVVVPASVVWQNDRAKIPPELACLQEPFGNAVFATATQELAGRAVAVLGCGPVGLFAIAIAQAFGAGRLLASDHVPYRIALARQLGADDVVDVDAVENVPEWFVEHNEGVGMGIVFEMSGALRAIEDAFAIVRHGGNVVLFRIPARPATIDIAESLIFKNLTVSAVNGREIWETWYTTRWLLEHGVVDLRPLITAELPLERFEEGLRCSRPARRARSSFDRTEPPHERRPERAGWRRARRAPRGADVQAVPHARVAPGARRPDGRTRRGDHPLLEQLPGARRPSRGGSRRHRGARALRSRNRVRAFHLRNLRAASRARARPRRSLGHEGCADLRLVLERERGRYPEPDRRHDGDPHGTSSIARASSTRSGFRVRRRRGHLPRTRTRARFAMRSPALLERHES